MIVTVTPNPSIDRTIVVPQLEVGEVNRAEQARIDPGGKGVNVARALSRNHTEATAIVPLGGPEGELLLTLLRDAGVRAQVVPVTGKTRTNVAVVDQVGTTTKINEPGPVLSEAELEALAEALTTHAHPGNWLALCGSLPPRANDTLLARWTRLSSSRVAIDASGPALKRALPAGPDLIKPNWEELRELTGADLPSLGAVIAAAHEIVAGGVGAVIVSLGGSGAVAVEARGSWFAQAHVAEPVSTVGAGDCLLAGALQALDEGASLADALARGVAWGSAAVGLPGTEVPSPSQIEAVTVVREMPPLDTPVAS